MNTPTAPADRCPARVITLALVAAALGMFLVQLDATVVNIALPTIAADLHSTVSGLQWVIDGYAVPLAACLLIGGRLGDRYDHRRVFIVGLTIFGLASVACAAATSVPLLVGARVLQGLGAALELPTSLALLARHYPDPAVRARAIGVWATIGGLALAVGPLLGGPLVDVAGWRTVFLLNVPIVAAALTLTLVGARRGGARADVPLNVAVQVCGTIVLAVATFAIIDAQRLATAPAWWLAVAAILVAAAAGFVAAERRAASPLIPASLMRHRSFAAATLAALAMGYGMFSIVFSYSLFFQRVWGDSAATAGARFLPLVLVFLAVGPLSSRLGAATRPVVASACGLGLFVAAFLTLAVLPTAAGFVAIGAAFAVAGVGYGLLATSLAIVAVESLPAAQHGLGAAVNNTARQVGGVLAVAIAGNLLRLPATGTALADAPTASGILTNPVTAVALAAAGLAAVAGVVVALLGRESS